MSRKEFLGQLERLLWDIPEQERKEALEYYKSYFEDAGEENESAVIQELGSPGKVAAIIKADLADNSESYGEYTETGYTDERFEQRDMPDTKTRAGYTNRGRESQRQPRGGLSWPLILILAIITVPIWGSVGLGILGLLIGVVLGFLGLAAGLLFGGLGVIIGGIAAIIHTIGFQLASPPTAIAAIGIGLILVAIGLLLITAFGWLAFKVFPVFFRWFVDFVHRILQRGSKGGGNV